MSAHTPGPWTVSTLDGRNVGPTTMLHTEEGIVPQLQSVAIVRERVGQSDANARLIAAAPELLAACRAVAAIHEGLADVDVGRAVLDCRAAIAKAEGR